MLVDVVAVAVAVEEVVMIAAVVGDNILTETVERMITTIKEIVEEATVVIEEIEASVPLALLEHHSPRLTFPPLVLS
jgi:hypothetical protein